MGMAAGQTAYALNNGGGLAVGKPLVYINDFTTNGSPGAGYLNIDIPSGFVVRSITKNPTVGTDTFVAFDPQTKTILIGAAGTNGLPGDRPDTAEDLIRMGVRQTRDNFGAHANTGEAPRTGIDTVIADILRENGLSPSDVQVVLGGQSLGGGVVKQLGAVLLQGSIKDSNGTDIALAVQIPPSNLTVVATNGFGVETPAELLELKADTIDKLKAATVVNLVAYTDRSGIMTQDLISQLGGSDVGISLGLRVTSDTNSSIGGLHRYNYGPREALEAIGYDFTKLTELQRNTPLDHDSFSAGIYRVDGVVGMPNNRASLLMGSFIALQTSSPGELAGIIANNLIQYRAVESQTWATVIGGAIELGLRALPAIHAQQVSAAVLGFLGVGKAIGDVTTRAPELGLPPVEEGVTRQLITGSDGTYVYVDSFAGNASKTPYATYYRADGATMTFTPSSRIDVRPDGATLIQSNESGYGVIELPRSKQWIEFERGDQVTQIPGKGFLIVSEKADGVVVYQTVDTVLERVTTQSGYYVNTTSGRIPNLVNANVVNYAPDATVPSTLVVRDVDGNVYAFSYKFNEAKVPQLDSLLYVNGETPLTPIDKKQLDELGLYYENVAGTAPGKLELTPWGKALMASVDKSKLRGEVNQTAKSPAEVRASIIKQAEDSMYANVSSLLQSIRGHNKLGIYTASASLYRDYLTVEHFKADPSNSSLNFSILNRAVAATASTLGMVSAIRGLRSDDLRSQIGGAVGLLNNANNLAIAVGGKNAGFISGQGAQALQAVGAVLSLASVGDIGKMLEHGQVGTAALTAYNAYTGGAYLLNAVSAAGTAGAASSSMVLAPVDPTTMILLVLASFVLDEIFKEDPPPPPPSGEAHFYRKGNGELAVSVSGEHGGLEILSGPMNQVLAALNAQLQDHNAHANPENALALVASRMPKVSIYSWLTEDQAHNGVDNYFFVLNYPDPQTGEERQMLLSRFDLESHYADGLPYGEALINKWEYDHLIAKFGSEANFKTEGQWARSVDAVEIERDRLKQVLAGAQDALTAAKENRVLQQTDDNGANVQDTQPPVSQATLIEQRTQAASAAQKALEDYESAHPLDPQQAARIDTKYQWLKAIGVDLGQDSFVRKALPDLVRRDLNSIERDGVARFDVDNDGYLEATEWLDGTDALLALDRNGNNSIDAGSELFNGIYTALGQRGSNSLRYYDANNDNRIDRADPVFKLLRLWLDLNGDGMSGSLELMDMDMNFAGVDMQALRERLKLAGAQAEAALASASPVDYIDLATMKFHFKDGGAAQAVDLALKSEIEGIQVEIDDRSGNITIVSENGQRDNFVTLVEDLTALQELKNPNIEAERKQTLYSLAWKYGLNPHDPSFFSTIDSLKAGGGNVIQDGPVYVTEADVASATNTGGSTALERTPWFETLMPGTASSDPTNPAAQPAPTVIKPTLPSDVYGLDYAVKGAQQNALVQTKTVVVSDPAQPGQQTSITLFTTAAPSQQLAQGSVSGKEDESFTFSFEQLLQDAKMALSASVTPRLLGVRSTANGHVDVDETNGRIRFTPDKNYNGTDACFTYSVLTASGAVVDRKIVLTLAAVNDAPVLTGETVETTEDHPLLLSPAVLLANDLDLESDAMTITGIGRVAFGKAVLQEDGLIRYTPPADMFDFTDTIEYVVADSRNASSVGTVKVHVQGVNDAPTVVSEVIKNAKEDTDLHIAARFLTANDFDPDIRAQSGAAPLKLTGVGKATGGTATLTSSGEVLFRPDVNFNGRATFEYTVADNSGLSTTGVAEVLVDAVNDAVSAYGETVSSNEDARLVFEPSVLLANEVDADIQRGEKQTLQIVAVDQATHGSVRIENGRVIFIPDANYHGQASFRYTVSDGAGSLDQAIAKIEIKSINDAPIVRNGRLLGQGSGVAIDITPEQIRSNADDVEDGTQGLTLVRVSDAQGGTLTKLANGHYSFTPVQTEFGTSSFEYVVQDREGLQSTARVYVDVDGKNDAPRFITGSKVAKNGSEDEELRLSESALLKMFVDIDGDPIRIDASSLKATPGDVVYFDAQTREVVYKPGTNVNGIRPLELKVLDDSGASIVQSIDLQFNAINDKPVVNAVGFEVLEDAGSTNPYFNKGRQLVRISDILAKASDVDGDQLIISSTSKGRIVSTDYQTDFNNDNATFDVTIEGDYLVFTTPLNFVGKAAFDYTVSDQHGGLVTQTAYVNVLPVDDAPDASISFVKQVGDYQYYRIDAYDPDLGRWRNRDPRDFKFELTQNPAAGTVTMNSPWTWEGNGFIFDAIGDGTGRSITSDISIKVSPRYVNSNNSLSSIARLPLTYRYDPIVIDLNNDGLSFFDIEETNVAFDANVDGVKERVSWVKPTEGILAWDYNSDNKITNFNELEFWSYVQPLDPHRSDLQSLSSSVFDANQDGRFDANDSKWSQFRIWRDLNSNGVSDAGELQTLAQAGIKTLYLRANTVNQLYGEHTLVRGFTRVEMTDGRLLQAADAEFTFAPSGWTPSTPITQEVSNLRYMTPEEIAAFKDDNRVETPYVVRQSDPSFEVASQAWANGQSTRQKVLTDIAYSMILPEALFKELGADQHYVITSADGSPLPDWLSYNPATRVLSGTPGDIAQGLWGIRVEGSNTAGLRMAGTVTIDVADKNTAPLLMSGIPVQSISEGQAFTLNIAPNLFRDPDLGDTLTIRASLSNGQALPDWLHFDTQTLTFSGTPDDDAIGSLSIQLIATDAAQTSQSAAFKLVIGDVEEGPTVKYVPPSLQLVLDRANSVSLSKSMFTDPDRDDALSYSMSLADGSALPSWLTFNTSTFKFTGTPTTTTFGGPLTVKLTATDLVGQQTSVLIDLMPSTDALEGPNSLAPYGTAGLLTQGMGGNDTLVANVNSTSNDTMEGGSGADVLGGGYGKDSLDGGSEDDALDGGVDDDILLGGTGFDTLVGGSGQDTLDGGQDNDELKGGAGADLYLFRRGSGTDYITDADELNTARFVDIASTDIEVSIDTVNLVFKVKGSNDSLIVRDFFKKNGALGTTLNPVSLSQLQFSDKTVDIGDFLPASVVVLGSATREEMLGTDGNDIIFGRDAYVNLSGGAGNDLISAGDGYGVLYGEDGDDTLVGSVYYSDSLIGGTGNDVYIFNTAQGDDIIKEFDNTPGNTDVLRLGPGFTVSNTQVLATVNDLIIRDKVTNSYITIANWFRPSFNGAARIERVEFVSATGSITTTWTQADLNAKTIVTPTDFVDYVNGTIGTLRADNIVVSGSNYYNNVAGGDGDDTISPGRVTSGSGWTSYVEGDAGNDTFVFGLNSAAMKMNALSNPDGSNNSTLAAHAGTDTLKLDSGILPSAVTFTEGASGGLTIKIEGARANVFLPDWQPDSDELSIDLISFSDGTTWNLHDTAQVRQREITAGHDSIVGTNYADTIDGLTGDDTLDGGAGYNLLRGSQGNDVYVISKLAQTTSVNESGLAADTDVVRFAEGISPSDLTLTRSYNDLLIATRTGSSLPVIKVTVSNWFDSYYSPSATNTRVERIEFSDPARTVWLPADTLNLITPIAPTTSYDRIYGNSSAETLRGDAGSDSIFGGMGADLLQGEADQDYLYGNSGDDTLIGGTQNDRMSGDMGRDTYVFRLGDGADTIDADDEFDSIQLSADFRPEYVKVTATGTQSFNLTFTNSASDSITVYGRLEKVDFLYGSGSSWTFSQLWSQATISGTTASSSSRYGDATDDSLRGYDGYDYLYGRGGNDTINGEAGGDYLYGDAGSDSLNGGTGSDSLYGGIGNDKLYGDADQDTLYGEDGHDLLSGGQGNDYLTGGAGNDDLSGDLDKDVLRGDGGEDALSGGLGDDTLYGGEGNDTLQGGAGADVIAGDKGRDLIVFNLGDGADTLQSRDNWATPSIVIVPADDADTLAFGSGIAWNNLRFSLSGSAGTDLLITLSNSPGDSVKLMNWFMGPGITTDYWLSGITLKDAGAKVYGPSDIINALTAGATTSGADGWGGSMQADTVDGLAGQDTLYGYDGDDRLAGGDDNDTLYGGNGADWLQGGAGNDSLYADGSASDPLKADTLDGGTGNDLMFAGNGPVTVLFGAGGGADKLIGTGSSTTVRIGAGLTPGNIVASVAGYGSDLVLTSSLNAGDNLTLSGLFSTRSANLTVLFDAAPGTTWTMADLRNSLGFTQIGTSGADNMSTKNAVAGQWLAGGAGNDTLKADNSSWGGADTLVGGTGDDLLTGSNYSEVYLFGAGDGHDRITDGWRSTYSDEIRLTGGITRNDLTFVRTSWGDLQIKVGTNGQDDLVLLNWLNAPYSGTAPVTATISFEATPGEYVRASDIDQALVMNGLPTGGADKLYAGAQNSVIDGGDGNDTITGFKGAEHLLGSRGDDLLIGGGGDDTLEGGAGNDTLSGSETGAQVYVVGSDEGDDTIQDSLYYGLDTVQFKSGIRAVDLEFSIENTYDIVIKYKFGHTGSLRLYQGDIGLEWSDTVLTFADRPQDSFKLSDLYTLLHPAAPASPSGPEPVSVIDQKLVGTANDDYLIGDVGNDSLYGRSGQDTLSSGTGYDYLDGGEGEDYYYIDLSGGRASVLAGFGDHIEIPLPLSEVQFERGDWITDRNAPEGGAWIPLNANDILGGKSLLIRGQDGVELACVLNVFTPEGNDISGLASLNLSDASLSFAELRAKVLNGGDWADRIVGFMGADTLRGQGGDDSLAGGYGNDRLLGGSGNDTLNGGIGIDSMLGGAGDDVYEVDSTADVTTELPGEGVDTIYSTVNRVLNAHFENLWLRDGAATTGTGNDGHNVLKGNIQSNTLIGGAGNDTLDGALGADTMQGGADNDFYVVDNVRDVVKELALEGIDTVQASVSYVLSDAVEDLILVGTDNATGIGNSLDNHLTGSEGDNVLDGGAGADTMSGGFGNDTYVVDQIGDQVIEAANQGSSDTVQSTISYTLKDNFENLRLLGSGHTSATGNLLSNALQGNSGDNRLIGLAGADTMDGGAGADTMEGGTGNDTYVVDSAGDVVSEVGGGGMDLVQVGILSSYTLGADIEHGTRLDAGALTGNALSNRLTGSGGADSLIGGAGADTLIGGAGGDSLVGGSGGDVYVVDNIEDVITELSNEGYDWVESEVSYTLSANVEDLSLREAAASALNATGNALDNGLSGNEFNNRLTGLAGDDWLDGGLGADTLLGGIGNDSYCVDNIDDVVTEGAAEGYDSVYLYGLVASSYTLSANLEYLDAGDTHAASGGTITLTGNVLSNAIFGSNSGVNNALYGADGNDTLYGMSGHDTLHGGSGADDMQGDAGDDTYVVDNTGDKVTEWLNAGNDTVNASISYTLGDNVENLLLTGTTDIHGAGNALNNRITGNSGSNFIDGGAGADTLIGGTGSDYYIIDNAGDVVTELANEGYDAVEATISYTLGANVEDVYLRGGAAAALNATGNTLDNGISGNEFNNVLNGGAGNDYIWGDLGNDTLIGGTGDDYFYVDTSGDVVTENANEGIDTVSLIGFVGNSYTLGANLENLEANDATTTSGTTLTLNGNNAANTIWSSSAGVNHALNGFGGNDALSGEEGNDTLDGGTGADALTGYGGNDTYVVDHIGDTVNESLNAGTDTVNAAISYTLGANVENLVLTGTAALNGTGNALANTLTGNSSSNVLDGGAGNDTLIGGAGGDTYYLDSTGDVVVEQQVAGYSYGYYGGGYDTAYLNFSGSYDFTNIYIEQFIAQAGAVNITGNSAGNYFSGSSGHDYFFMGAGDDNAWGGDGNDTLVSGADYDVLSGGNGVDTYIVDMSLSGTAEIGVWERDGDILDLRGVSSKAALKFQRVEADSWGEGDTHSYWHMGAGTTVMIQATGLAGSVIVDLFKADGSNAGGLQTIKVAGTTISVAEIKAALAPVTTAGNDTLFGYDVNETMAGGAGNDWIVGAGGVDNLSGGDGRDTIVGAGLLDGGKDADTLSLTDGSNIASQLLGGEGDDVLNGYTWWYQKTVGSVLDGGKGNDNMQMGAYDQTVHRIGDGVDMIGNANATNIIKLEGFKLSDLVVSRGLSSTNLLMGNKLDLAGDQLTISNYFASASRAQIQVLNESGTAYVTVDGATMDSLARQGSVLNDYLVGTDGIDMLDGKSGNDYLSGAKGNDTLYGGDGNDTIWGGAGDDSMMGGLGDDYLQDREGNNRFDGGDGHDGIYGGTGNDSLTGGAGNDSLSGGGGADTLIGGIGNDQYSGYFMTSGSTITIQEQDATVGNVDCLMMGYGSLNPYQILLRQSGNDLRISGLSGTGAVIIRDWFLGTDRHVESITTSGYSSTSSSVYYEGTLADTGVQALVTAMAGFTPVAGQLEIADAALRSKIDAAWGTVTNYFSGD